MTTWYQLNEHESVLFSHEMEMSEAVWAEAMQTLNVTDEHSFDYSVHEGVHMYVFHEPEPVTRAVRALQIELDDLKPSDFRTTPIPRTGPRRD